MANETTMTPRQHAGDIAGLLRQGAQEAGTNIHRVDDPKAQALFETIREVVNGAIKALEDYEQQREAIWR